MLPNVVVRKQFDKWVMILPIVSNTYCVEIGGLSDVLEVCCLTDAKCRWIFRSSLTLLLVMSFNILNKQQYGR